MKYATFHSIKKKLFLQYNSNFFKWQSPKKLFCANTDLW